MVESEEELKSLLMRVKEESEEVGLLFWVPDVLCWHSEVVLWSLLDI